MRTSPSAAADIPKKVMLLRPPLRPVQAMAAMLRGGLLLLRRRRWLVLVLVVGMRLRRRSGKGLAMLKQSSSGMSSVRSMRSGRGIRPRLVLSPVEGAPGLFRRPTSLLKATGTHQGARSR